mgnify:CR=1 FL=1
MNPFRQMLRAAGGKPPIGTWISSASPIVAEAVGHAGFDWGVVDMEHAPLDLMGVVHLLQALGNTKMLGVVRLPWNDAVVVKRLLDAGATTLLFPFVQNAGEAMRAVAATRYPPAGMRGMSGASRARSRKCRPWPLTTSVPANTLSAGCFATGSDSPVSKASSARLRPSSVAHTAVASSRWR